jgi:chromosome segregation ATPase
MSNSFEFSAKADEWLDVTSKEELLQNELNRTKNDLETRSMELLESNVTIDLLIGHKTLLENERNTLQGKLMETTEVLMTTEKDLENTTECKQILEKNLQALKTSSESKELNLEQVLTSCKEELGAAKSHITNLDQHTHTMKKEQQKEKTESTSTIDRLTKFVEQLNSNIRSLENSSKMQAEEVAKSRKELQESRSREEALRRDLAKQTSLTEQRTKELKGSQDNMGSVSVLAENLKDKNNSLVRSVESLQQNLSNTKDQHTASTRREAALQAEIAKVQAKTDDRTKKQEQIIADGLNKLEHAEDRIVGLEAYAEDLKEQFVSVSEQCESLVASISEKDSTIEELADEKESLEIEMQDQSEAMAADLENAKDALAREEAIKKELKHQRAVFDARLKEIRSILGVTAINEIKTEIHTVARIYAEKQRACPSIKAVTLRVPLLVDLHKSK